MTWNQTQNEVSQGGGGTAEGACFWLSVIRPPCSCFAELDVAFWVFCDLKLCKTVGVEGARERKKGRGEGSEAGLAGTRGWDPAHISQPCSPAAPAAGL